MRRYSILFVLPSLMLLMMLQGVIAVRGSTTRVQPLAPDSPPPSPPPSLPDVMTSRHQPFRIEALDSRDQYETSSLRLQWHLQNRYDLPLARVNPALREPIPVATLEDQIRRYATHKHFIRLGEDQDRYEMRLAFAVHDTFQDDGQKYFGILALRRPIPGFDPSFELLGYVKTSGVHGVVDRMRTVENRLRLEWPGQALTSYDVFRQVRNL
ncbi:uncharacterized protein UTRI_06245_B [Ustilago trichophora]|uniref:Uncharacterized protein n=1 Tax=Ustilago trichophora TaxID=86804 RepID=A0A5C3EH75_9BASI|nr:uncharacterized protein UTRI_06245_B [Ustilago trichophora]